MFVDQGLAAYLRMCCAELVDEGLRKMGRMDMEKRQRRGLGGRGYGGGFVSGEEEVEGYDRCDVE